MPQTPRAPRRRDAHRVLFVLQPGPALLVLALVAGSVATWALTAGQGAARGPSTPSALPADAFRPMPVATASPAASERTTRAPVRPTSSPSPIATPDPTPPAEPPAVVRFRPRHGWTGVSHHAEVSIRFTKAMEHVSTEAAFRALVDGKPVAGTYRWAEGDTVLVLRPGAAFPYRARVTLWVDATARDVDGLAIGAARSVTFTIEPKPAPTRTPTPRPAPVASSSGWQWPLLGRITQRFGESLTVYGYHQGIDIDGETGDPIRATRAGRVTVAGYYDQCGGLDVHIDHGGGLESWYRHLSRIDVAFGATVSAGTLIGRVGDTGCSFGSHLHFGIRLNRTFVDPLRYLPPR